MDPPQGVVLTAFQNWFYPDLAQNIIPLRNIRSFDLKHVTRGRNNLNELKIIMSQFEILIENHPHLEMEN
jgi:hypothetical protein